MKRTISLLLSIVVVNVLCCTQNNINIHNEDNCNDIIMEKHRAINMPDSLLKKNYIEVIQHDNLEEVKDSFSRSSMNSRILTFEELNMRFVLLNKFP